MQNEKEYLEGRAQAESGAARDNPYAPGSDPAVSFNFGYSSIEPEEEVVKLQPDQEAPLTVGEVMDGVKENGVPGEAGVAGEPGVQGEAGVVQEQG